MQITIILESDDLTAESAPLLAQFLAAVPVKTPKATRKPRATAKPAQELQDVPITVGNTPAAPDAELQLRAAKEVARQADTAVEVAEEVARQALNALGKKTLLVPGFLNRLVAVITQLAPRAFATRVAGRLVEHATSE